MCAYLHLNRAPISEAIISFQVDPSEGVDGSTFEAIQEIKTGYPNKLPHWEFSGTLNFDPSEDKPAQQSSKSLQGFDYRSEDNRRVARFTVGVLSYHRLKEYTSWEDVFAEAQRLWDIYVGLCRPRRVRRLSVRYVNHIDVRPKCRLSDYLRTPPQAVNDLVMTHFLDRKTVTDQHGLFAHVTQASGRTPLTDDPAIILDIDAYKDVDLDCGDASLVDEFAKLREFKNKIFFGSITKRTVEVYR